jgi:ligand-binding sensor domain-containing protein
MLKYFCITLNLLLFTIIIYPQENYVFEHFSIPEGLSNPTVFSILQDSYGFIWIGTADGLNRYDGFEFKVYKNDPADCQVGEKFGPFLKMLIKTFGLGDKVFWFYMTG